VAKTAIVRTTSNEYHAVSRARSDTCITGD
jgi:hypothetical protein